MLLWLENFIGFCYQSLINLDNLAFVFEKSLFKFASKIPNTSNVVNDTIPLLTWLNLSYESELYLIMDSSERTFSFHNFTFAERPRKSNKVFGFWTFLYFSFIKVQVWKMVEDKLWNLLERSISTTSVINGSSLRSRPIKGRKVLFGNNFRRNKF